MSKDKDKMFRGLRTSPHSLVPSPEAAIPPHPALGMEIPRRYLLKSPGSPYFFVFSATSFTPVKEEEDSAFRLMYPPQPIANMDD